MGGRLNQNPTKWIRGEGVCQYLAREKWSYHSHINRRVTRTVVCWSEQNLFEEVHRSRSEIFEAGVVGNIGNGISIAV